MTTYTYKCHKCLHVQEHDQPQNYIFRKHGNCDRGQMWRVRKAPAVRYVGSGWYGVDSKRVIK